MPTFDFQCRKCNHVFETSVPFGSKELPDCPECGSKRTEKLLSPPLGIHFKGSGFYKTDSRVKETKESDETKTDATKDTSTPKSDGKKV